MSRAKGVTTVRDRRTLAVAFDPRFNSLNALRLMLATSVIVSHAWPIGGFGNDPEIGHIAVGGWAVAGFFGISGYLIAASRLRSPLLGYLWRRFLRVFPGLWISLLAVVLVFAPIAAVAEPGPDHVVSRDAVTFVAANGVLNHVEGIGGTLSGVPYTNTWNGSLWTLFYEFVCYLILGAVFALPFVRRRPASWLWALFAGSLAVTAGIYELDRGVPFRLHWLAYLGTYFWAGALLCVYASRVRINALVAVAALALLVAGGWTAHEEVLAAIPFVYLMLFLGVTLPLQRVGRRNDISYGVYIYAFPIQQLLVLAHANRLGVAAYVLLAIACTLPLAAASWFLVERPAIGLKRFGVRRRRARGRLGSAPARPPGSRRSSRPS